MNCKVCGQVPEWCWCKVFKVGSLTAEQRAQIKDGLKKIRPLSFKQKLEGYYDD